ncbi:MAG: histidine phosphatase family protein [Candidatus Nanopelagicales bacterium]
MSPAAPTPCARGEIWLVRHGQTEWSRTGRHTGRTDIGLTVIGEDEAKALAEPLASHAFGLALSSPLIRARHTAELAGMTEVSTDARLLEWDYGGWEGMTTDEIRAQRHDEKWTIWSSPVPPGTTMGEQATEVASRTGALLSELRPVLSSGNDVILFAHGHVLRILTATWIGLPAVDARLWALDPARVSILGHEHEQQVVRQWNGRP